MQDLLRESEFAKIWEDQPIGNTWTTSTNYCNSGKNTKSYYDKNGLIVASVDYNAYHELLELMLYCDSSDYVEQFINDFKVTPYTYVCYVLKNVKADLIVKPFTYEFVCEPTIQSNLPICVVHHNPLVNSVLKKHDPEEEYKAAKRLQRDVMHLKSAK